MTDKNPTYTRRHFEDIAILLSHTDDKALINRFADFFADDNSQFDRVRFLTAIHKQSLLRHERDYLRSIRPDMEAECQSSQ